MNGERELPPQAQEYLAWFDVFNTATTTTTTVLAQVRMRTRGKKLASEARRRMIPPNVMEKLRS
jgi:hypothetical protein